MKVKKVIEEWEIWNKVEKAAKSKEEANKLIWFLKGFTNEFMSLKRKQVKEYQQKKYEIM